MRNACLGATFKGNVVETRGAALSTNTAIILDLWPCLSGVSGFFYAIQKPPLTVYFLKLSLWFFRSPSPLFQKYNGV